MPQDKVRAKEATAQLSVSGERLGGSMLKIFNFRVDPDVEEHHPRSVGEARARADLDVRGYRVSFQSRVSDRVWFDLWQQIQAADEVGDPFPEVSMAVTIAHRQGPPLTFVLHGDMVLRLTPFERPEEGYVTHSWEGYCSFMDEG